MVNILTEELELPSLMSNHFSFLLAYICGAISGEWDILSSKNVANYMLWWRGCIHINVSQNENACLKKRLVVCFVDDFEVCPIIRHWYWDTIVMYHITYFGIFGKMFIVTVMSRVKFSVEIRMRTAWREPLIVW